MRSQTLLYFIMNLKRQNKHLWITIASLSIIVLCWGLWILLKPDSTAQPAESLQGILMDHIKYMPEVYRAHEDYSNRLHDDTCAILIYRYTPNVCNSCYLEDLFDIK